MKVFDDSESVRETIESLLDRVPISHPKTLHKIENSCSLPRRKSAAEAFSRIPHFGSVLLLVYPPPYAGPGEE